MAKATESTATFAVSIKEVLSTVFAFCALAGSHECTLVGDYTSKKGWKGVKLEASTGEVFILPAAAVLCAGGSKPTNSPLCTVKGDVGTFKVGAVAKLTFKGKADGELSSTLLSIG